jgi:hypothetical protein
MTLKSAACMIDMYAWSLVHMHEGQSYDIPECVSGRQSTHAWNDNWHGMLLISSNYKHLTNYMQTSPL